MCGPDARLPRDWFVIVCNVARTVARLSRREGEHAHASPAIDPNPLRRGLLEDRGSDACAVVIFGASGDLTKRKLMPALYNLAVRGRCRVASA